MLITEDDKFIWILMGGLTALSEAFGFIHGMYHEATACHVLTDISDCLFIMKSLLSVALARTEEEYNRPQGECLYSLHLGTRKVLRLSQVERVFVLLTK